MSHFLPAKSLSRKKFLLRPGVFAALCSENHFCLLHNTKLFQLNYLCFAKLIMNFLICNTKFDFFYVLVGKI